MNFFKKILKTISELKNKIILGLLIALFVSTVVVGYLYKGSLGTIANQNQVISEYSEENKKWKKSYDELEKDYKHVFSLYKKREEERDTNQSRIDSLLQQMREYDDKAFNDCRDVLLPHGLRAIRPRDPSSTGE